MKSKPKVSIITITKNNLMGLRLTHASLYLQDSNSFEWIVVDGASTDGTLEFLQEVQETLPKIRVLSQSDSGIFQAMNRGIELSSGQYLLFLNSGDALADNRVLSEFQQTNFESEIIYGNCLFAKGNFLQRLEFPPKLSLNFLLINYICHTSTFIKRDAFLKIGNYDETFSFAGDYGFFLRAFLSNEFIFSHWARVVSRFDGTGMSNQRKNALKILRERWRAARRYIITSSNEYALLRALLYRFFRLKMGRRNLIWACENPLKFLFDDFCQLDKAFEAKKQLIPTIVLSNFRQSSV